VTEEIFDQGMQIRREVLGGAHVDRSLQNATDFTRPMQELLTRYCWGELWGRPGLDRRTRSFLNLAMLTALNRPHEIRLHVQVVRVETAHGPLVLASDATHYYANFEQTRPFPVVLHVGEMLDAYDRLRQLVDDPGRIVPRHDPRVMERFLPANAQCEGIAVWLDPGCR